MEELGLFFAYPLSSSQLWLMVAHPALIEILEDRGKEIQLHRYPLQGNSQQNAEEGYGRKLLIWFQSSGELWILSISHLLF